MRKDQWFDNSIKMIYEGRNTWDRSTYRFVNESRFKFFFPRTRSSSRHTRPQIKKNNSQTAAATWMNFCCPPLKLSLRSTQGLAYDSDSWWSNRLAELNSLAMSWVRGQEHENKNFWYSIPMGESPIFLIELLITKLTRQVCIINTYSTYRTSSICPTLPRSPPPRPPQAPFDGTTCSQWRDFFV